LEEILRIKDQVKKKPIRIRETQALGFSTYSVTPFSQLWSKDRSQGRIKERYSVGRASQGRIKKRSQGRIKERYSVGRASQGENKCAAA
jgi:hypothetical protein